MRERCCEIKGDGREKDRQGDVDREEGSWRERRREGEDGRSGAQR